MAWELSLEQIIEATGGTLMCSTHRVAKSIATDTRKSCEGALFIALRGENFDAHKFVDQAVAQGARILLVSSWQEGWNSLKATFVVVEDTLKALQDLGKYWRHHCRAKILAVTGSNGKTTSKDFAYSLLSQHFRVSATKGSLNNHWGVPLSLLAIDPSDDVAIIEMGMNHFGEISRLVSIAEPDVVGVTMVGRGHLEGVGSIEGVAQAKEEIYLGASSEALRIFNLDNPYTNAMWERAQAKHVASKLVTFSQNPHLRADVCIWVEEARWNITLVKGVIRGQSFECQVPVFGSHNVTNLMMAVAFALAVEMPIAKIIESLPLCHSSWGRNQWYKLPSGARVLFDGYNANPESMTALLTNLDKLDCHGAKWAVLGEMLEIGESSNALHFELGCQTARAGFSQVWFIGPHGAEFAAGMAAGGFSNTPLISTVYEESLAMKIASMIGSDDVVAVKGSRGVGLEQFVEFLAPVDFQAKS